MCFFNNVAFIRSYSGEEETANLLLGKFKWGHAFLSLNRYTSSSFIELLIKHSPYKRFQICQLKPTSGDMHGIVSKLI